MFTKIIMTRNFNVELFTKQTTTSHIEPMNTDKNYHDIYGNCKSLGSPTTRSVYWNNFNKRARILFYSTRSHTITQMNNYLFLCIEFDLLPTNCKQPYYIDIYPAIDFINTTGSVLKQYTFRSMLCLKAFLYLFTTRKDQFLFFHVSFLQICQVV